MSWRTVIISSHAKLDLQVGFLQVRSIDETKRIILDEIDILLIESTAVSLTAALLAELIRRKVKVIFCDSTRNPLAELIPYHTCHDSNRRLKMQLKWSEETKGKIWQTIVKEKVSNQAKILGRFGYYDAQALLERFAEEVEPCDIGNREGLAAKNYFHVLFWPGFTRELDCDINNALNYGYQILLAVFSRELTSEGYLTQLGIFHDSVYNNFNLASDLMEPFRPIIDAIVKEWFLNCKNEFDTTFKRRIIAALHDEITISGSKQTLINAVISYVRSVTDALNNNTTEKLRFPLL